MTRMVACLQSLPSPFGRGAGGEGSERQRRKDRGNTRSNRPHPNPLPKGEGTVLSISRYTLIALCLLLGTAISCSAAEPTEFRFSREIDRGDAKSENIVSVTLDSDVYACTRSEFPDLRIFDKEDQEVPRLVEKNEKYSESDKKSAYPVAKFRIEEDPTEKSTLVYVDMRREPLTGLTLETGSRNFSRSARVQKPMTRGGRSSWVDVGQGVLSRIGFGGQSSETLGLSFPEQRESEYRIVIRNEDNPPLKILGVKADENVYRVVFLAAENENYRLVYGSDDVGTPVYDTAAVLAPLRQGQKLEEARLGKETEQVPSTPEPGVKSLINNPLLLGGAIVLLVVVLGWALFRAAGRINEIPKE
jgi:hypothetical protein